MSAPQWSTGRPIKRSPAAPPQTRGARPSPSTLSPAPVEPAQTILDRAVPDLAVPDLAGSDLANRDLTILDLADSRLADSRLADSSLADSGLADSGLADSRLADSRLADSRLADLGFGDSGRADPGLGPTGGGPHPVELAGLLHELSALLLSADDLSQALRRLAAFTAGAVPGAWRCSVVLIGERAPLTVAASGPHAQAFDDLQYATGQGPGLDAARTRTLVTAHDMARDPRWPELSDCARAEGLHAVAAIPLDVQRSWVGALSLYARRGEGIGPDLLLTAMALVGQAEVLLGELRRRAALGEGATVDRAAGVIIAQRGCGVHEAYDVLAETANRLGLDRHTVADRLVAAAASRHPDS